MGTGAGSYSSSTYDVSSEALTWYESAAIAPLGFMSDYIQYTHFVLSTPYISAVSTTAGEWYSGFKSLRLENAFITYLAKYRTLGVVLQFRVLVHRVCIFGSRS
jgi:membrane-bound acyltransferase YfiQ involved in biofilm formation